MLKRCCAPNCLSPDVRNPRQAAEDVAVFCPETFLCSYFFEFAMISLNLLHFEGMSLKLYFKASRCVSISEHLNLWTAPSLYSSVNIRKHFFAERVIKN